MKDKNKFLKINPLTQYELLQIELEITLIKSQLDKFEETNTCEENSEVIIKMIDRLDYLVDIMQASIYWTKRSKLKLIEGGKQ